MMKSRDRKTAPESPVLRGESTDADLLKKYEIFSQFYMHWDRTHTRTALLYGSVVIIYLGLVSSRQINLQDFEGLRLLAAALIIAVWFSTMVMIARVTALLHFHHQEMRRIEEQIMTKRRRVGWLPTSYVLRFIITIMTIAAVIATLSPKYTDLFGELATKVLNSNP